MIFSRPGPAHGGGRAPRICQLIPEGVRTLYEPFAGSAAITIYAATHKMVEDFVILIDLWELILNAPTELSGRYSEIWYAHDRAGRARLSGSRSAAQSHRCTAARVLGSIVPIAPRLGLAPAVSAGATASSTDLSHGANHAEELGRRLLVGWQDFARF